MVVMKAIRKILKNLPRKIRYTKITYIQKKHQDNNVKYSVNASSLFATSFVTNETN